MRSTPKGLWALLAAGALLATSCTVPVHSTAPSVSSVPTVSTVLTLSTALPDATPTGAVVVTVPDLATVAAPGTSPGPGPSVAGSTRFSSRPALPSSVAASPSSQAGPTDSTTSSSPPTVAITLAGCAACAVLATHAGVTGNLSAALLAAGAGRAILVSVRADGSVGSAANMTYGATFATPSGGVLPCDDGRCVVVGVRSDGHAVASAWSLGGDGRWTDVSIPGGFVSSSSSAQAVDLDGELGIAVQLGPSLWTTYAWSDTPPDSGYAVLGCESDPSAAPVASACPS